MSRQTIQINKKKTMATNKVCSVCQLVAEFVCQNCCEQYCSRKCQSLDWYNHKNVCSRIIPSLVKTVSCPVTAKKSPSTPKRRIAADIFGVKSSSINDARSIQDQENFVESVPQKLVETSKKIISINEETGSITDVKAFATVDDLEIVPIPVGIKIDLYCLDFSNIKKGYISACVNDAEKIHEIDAMNVEISKYCALQLQDSYSPNVSELCLALCTDGEWYRALVVEVIDSSTFRITFIDYGDMTIIKNSNIRKITKKFLQPSLTNKCYIKGVPDKITHIDIENLASYFIENKIISINSATKEHHSYLVDVPELQWW